MYFRGIVEIDEEDLSGSLRAAELVPTVAVENNVTLDPAISIVSVDDAVNTFNVTVYQGTAADTLFRTTTPGTHLDVTFQRERGVGKPTATFTVASMPGPFGGEAGTTLSYPLTLQVVGDVTWGISV